MISSSRQIWYIPDMGRIADRFRGFLRKAGDKLFHKECAEPAEGHEDEKPATMLDDALSALSVISGKHDSAEETFGKISAQIEGISSSADVMSFAINRNEQRNISMILLSGSAAAMVFIAIGLPYISLIAAMAAAIAAFSVRNIPGNGEKGTNISLSIEPSGPADRTVVFSCHYDRREKKNSRYMKLASPVFPLLSLAAEAVIALLSLSLEILQGILLRPNLALADSVALSIAAFIPAMFVLVWPLAYTGETREENLAPAASVIALAKHFAGKAGKGNGLKSTRLVFAFFGGTGAGFQGSRAWFKSKGKMLEDAIVLNIDSIGRSDHLRLSAGSRAYSFADNLFRFSSSVLGRDIKMERRSFFSEPFDDISALNAGIQAVTLYSGEDEKAEADAIDSVLMLCEKIAIFTDGKDAEEGLASEKRKNRISRY